MKKLNLITTILIALIGFISISTKAMGPGMNMIYNFTAKTIDLEEKSLADYRGKVLLIVNVASFCGNTPQYTGLQALYSKYQSKGLEILGFPCNQFGKQESGTNKEIKDFCTTNYSVTFQLFDKIDVNGENAHPIYKYLIANAPGDMNGKPIRWNFTKFLIDRNGNILKRYDSKIQPEEMEKDIEKMFS